MRKVIFAIFLIYLVAIIENSFFNYWFANGRGVDLILITFLGLLFSRNWTSNQLLLIGGWTGLILDIFRYPAFGTGIITILVLSYIYHLSHRWFFQSSRTINLIPWLFFYNLLFCLLLIPVSHSLAALFHQPFGLGLGSLKDLFLSLLYNVIIVGLGLFLIKRVRKSFFKLNV